MRARSDKIYFIAAGILITLCFLVICFKFVFNPVIVIGSSMEPTYSNGTFISITKVNNNDNFSIGDVIVFSEGADENLIKRIVALPGDTICISDGVLYRNNSAVVSRFDKMDFSGILEEEYIVPSGHVFVLGDNRNNSKDSRCFGAVPYESIMGIVSQVLLEL